MDSHRQQQRGRGRRWLKRVGAPVLVMALLYQLPPVRSGVQLTRLFFANGLTGSRWLAPGDSLVVPFEQKLHVLLPVRVNGSPVLSFALDTGAPFPAIIGSPVTEGLGLDLGARVSVGGTGTGPDAQSRVVSGLTLAVGRGSGVIELRRQTAVYIPWKQFGGLIEDPAEVYLQGILGYDLFRRTVVELDFERRIATLHRPESYRYEGDGEVLPLRFAQRKPYVDAEVTLADGVRIPVRLHVDVGQTATLTLIPGSRPEIRIPEHTLAATGYGLSGRVEKRIGRIRELRFGKLRLESPLCTFPLGGHSTEGGRHGTIGLGVLSRFHVVLDYPQKRMILEATANTGLSFEANMSGATFTPWGDTYVLKRIRPDSPAQEAGLEVGDRLVVLDGEPAESLQLPEIQKRLSAGDGKTVRVEARRGNEILTAELVLRRRI